MPFGDNTGPLGLGPMTGRGRGFCAGNAAPGRFNSASGFGMGRGGRGCHGWHHRFRAHGFDAGATLTAVPPAPANQQQEVSGLRDMIDGLLNTLSGIRKRVEELEARPKPE
jgi:hypothetical protein